MNNIIFLGTGSGSLVTGKQIKATGGIIIQSGNNQFHLDPGPGALVRAREFNVNLRENTAILVSHSHLSHCNDLNAVISAMTHNGLDKKGVLILNKSFVDSADTKSILTDFHKNCVEKVIIMEPDKNLGVEDVEIKALSTVNSEQNTIGFKFSTPEFVLSYSSDTEYSAELISNYRDSDILILNVPSPHKKENNLNMNDAIEILTKTKPKLAIIQHFDAEMLKMDPLTVAREIQKRSGVQTLAAADGLVISPTNYSARSKQKTLKGFNS